jgi:hypothetical protein
MDLAAPFAFRGEGLLAPVLAFRGYAFGTGYFLVFFLFVSSCAAAL